MEVAPQVSDLAIPPLLISLFVCVPSPYNDDARCPEIYPKEMMKRKRGGRNVERLSRKK